MVKVKTLFTFTEIAWVASQGIEPGTVLPRAYRWSSVTAPAPPECSFPLGTGGTRVKFHHVNVVAGIHTAIFVSDHD